MVQIIGATAGSGIAPAVTASPPDSELDSATEASSAAIDRLRHCGTGFRHEDLGQCRSRRSKLGRQWQQQCVRAARICVAGRRRRSRWSVGGTQASSRFAACSAASTAEASASGSPGAKSTTAHNGAPARSARESVRAANGGGA